MTTRREALSALSTWMRASPLLRGQQPPLRELVNVFEIETEARKKLAPEVFNEISGGDRSAFDRMTLHPRLLVDTTKLDLSVDIFGTRHFAPILVGPTANHARFHADAEAATAQGASAAKAAMVIAGASSLPIDKIIGERATSGADLRSAAGLQAGPFWFQLAAAGDIDAARNRAQHAIQLGCKAICVTTAASAQAWAWPEFARFVRDLPAPVLLKGVMTPAEARTAVEHGARGIVVSNYRAGSAAPAMAAPVLVLPAIAEAVGASATVLIDGGFRRGTDIFKALAFGAQAVLLGRPPLWGLASYGAAGVQYAVEMLQTELARAMAMCGAANLAAIRRDHVRVHKF